MKQLNKYFFPVDERKVYFEDKLSDPKRTKEYKAIIRTDKNKLISIMQDSYKLMPNSKVILPLMEQLDKLDKRWIIDNSHSFVEDSRMRLQVTFPDITINDGKSDIALSLFLHNSYDGSEGIRSYFGGIRGICSNGMVLGKVLAKFYAKHTKNVAPGNLKESIEAAYEQIPVIKQRIEILQNLEVTDVTKENVETKLGKNITKYVDEQPIPENQYILLNYITYYISHLIDKRMRAAYQMKVSKLFNL